VTITDADLVDEPRTTWQPTDLTQIVRGVLSGEVVGPVPTLLVRLDGRALLYRGEVHSPAGEPESGKSWLVQHESVQLIERGERVLYLDFETAAPSVVERLLALGASAQAVVDHFVYVRPDEPPTDARIAELAEGRFALVVLDGVTEAYELLGLDPLSNRDAAAGVGQFEMAHSYASWRGRP